MSPHRGSPEKISRSKDRQPRAAPAKQPARLGLPKLGGEVVRGATGAYDGDCSMGTSFFGFGVNTLWLGPIDQRGVNLQCLKFTFDRTDGLLPGQRRTTLKSLSGERQCPLLEFVAGSRLGSLHRHDLMDVVDFPARRVKNDACLHRLDLVSRASTHSFESVVRRLHHITPIGPSGPKPIPFDRSP